jgi:hypothetical protein
MTFNLHRYLSAATLRRLVPRRYHPQMKWSEFADAKTAALLFEHKRKEVVTHTMVQQILDAIGPLDEPFKVAVAANLTHEAAKLLAASGFTVPLKTQVPKVPPQTQSIPFPERVHYSSAKDTSGWRIVDWETANHLLGYLHPEKMHFVIFGLPDDSYVQCLGSKKALTVEARVYRSDRGFLHWRFGIGPPCGLQTKVGASQGTVTIDRTQVLQMRDARLIIRQFLETRTFPPQYHQEDITQQLAGHPALDDAAPRFPVRAEQLPRPR